MDNKLENDINLLVSELKKSDLSRDDALDYLNHVFRSTVHHLPDNGLVAKTVTDYLIVTDYLKKASAGNFKYSSGFYGNWAKSSIEKKED